LQQNRNWTDLSISKFSPYDFDVEITKFGGTAYIKAPALPSTPWHQLSRRS